ncbi:type IV pilus modification PilV family protein [Wohlfahrtiimonas populi]|uniref:type IV pilus modification PilV family protein n=1 Tax=Wohlfahrtiimonas populi TaxID=1940240 RepID=UPI00098D5EB0|nr:hypothetical protein [Wohlfahrtiimonas populi]
MIIKQQQGSFLLEFLIALGIFSIAIVGLVKLQNRAISDLGDLGSDMAIPILIDDFTARLNIAENNDIDVKSLKELQDTAKVMMKEVALKSKDTITITDILDPSKTHDYTVVIDYSGREH